MKNHSIIQLQRTINEDRRMFLLKLLKLTTVFLVHACLHMEENYIYWTCFRAYNLKRPNIMTWFCADVCKWGPGFSAKAGGFLCLYLICFLVEAGRHLQQCTALIQRCSKSLPLLLQLPRDLLDLLRGVMARLQQPVPDWHDPVNVHVHVLG